MRQLKTIVYVNVFFHAFTDILLLTTMQVFLFFFIMRSFSKSKLNILSAPRLCSSGCFTIQTFMNMVCEGILCRYLTAQGTLYNEW